MVPPHPLLFYCASSFILFRLTLLRIIISAAGKNRLKSILLGLGLARFTRRIVLTIGRYRGKVNGAKGQREDGTQRAAFPFAL